MKKGNKRTNYKFHILFETAKTELEKDSAEFHAPRGNDKTGEIPAFNLLPGVTCSAEACGHCMREGCYAIKNLFRGGYDINSNSTFRAWCDNYVMAVKHIYTLETRLDAWLTENTPSKFRIHSSGDFVSVEYARMWRRLALKHPETRFLAFTKQWEIVRRVLFYKVDNFELVLSAWTCITPPDDLRRHYRVAYCNDGECEIPENAFHCPGDCETCGMCWNLSILGLDTYFDKH